MYIHEAIKEAEKVGKPYIHRTSDDSISKNCKYIPTDTPDCIIVVILPCPGVPEPQRSIPRWNPQKCQLLADDWEPCD